MADFATESGHKTCRLCGQAKAREEFYRHPNMADGRLSKCIACTKKLATGYRNNKIEETRAYDRDRSHLPHRRLLSQRIINRWRALYPERRQAQSAVSNALRDGRLTRQPCWVCGRKADAHHPDYSRPLQVVWLCRVHHSEVHALVEDHG